MARSSSDASVMTPGAIHIFCARGDVALFAARSRRLRSYGGRCMGVVGGRPAVSNLLALSCGAMPRVTRISVVHGDFADGKHHIIFASRRVTSRRWQAALCPWPSCSGSNIFVARGSAENALITLVWRCLRLTSVYHQRRCFACVWRDFANAVAYQLIRTRWRRTSSCWPSSVSTTSVCLCSIAV